MTRHIKLLATCRPHSDNVKVQITYQSHIHIDFTPEGRYEFAGKEATIASSGSPEVHSSTYFFLRGINTQRDNTIMSMSNESYRRLKSAVLEYNETYK